MKEACVTNNYYHALFRVNLVNKEFDANKTNGILEPSHSNCTIKFYSNLKITLETAALRRVRRRLHWSDVVLKMQVTASVVTLVREVL